MNPLITGAEGEVLEKVCANSVCLFVCLLIHGQKFMSIGSLGFDFFSGLASFSLLLSYLGAP